MLGSEMIITLYRTDREGREKRDDFGGCTPNSTRWTSSKSSAPCCITTMRRAARPSKRSIRSRPSTLSSLWRSSCASCPPRAMTSCALAAEPVAMRAELRPPASVSHAQCPAPRFFEYRYLRRCAHRAPCWPAGRWSRCTAGWARSAAPQQRLHSSAPSKLSRARTCGARCATRSVSSRVRYFPKTAGPSSWTASFCATTAQVRSLTLC